MTVSAYTWCLSPTVGLLSLAQLFADLGVTILIQGVLDFVQEVGSDHESEGNQGDEDQHTDLLTALDLSNDVGDGADLLGFGDGAKVSSLLERGDLVGVLGDTEQNVGQSNDGNADSGTKLGDEGTKRSDDGIISFTVLPLIVLDGIHDGDHHDQVVSVESEVSKHVTDGDAPELHGIAGWNESADDEHGTVSDGRNDQHLEHERLTIDALGDSRIEDHQESGGHHTDGGEEGPEATFITELEVDVHGAKTVEADVLTYLLQQERNGDPAELIILGDDIDDLFEADGRNGFLFIGTIFLDTEEGGTQEQGSQETDDHGDLSVSVCGVASDGHAACGEQGDQNGSSGAAETGEQGGSGSDLITHMGIGSQGRDHSPEGDVMHGVGNGIQEVDHAEEDDEAVSLQVGIESKVDDQRSGHDTDGQPGLELTPLGSGAVDNVAHDRVVESIEDSSGYHDGTDGSQLAGSQLTGEHNVSQDKAGEQLIDHIASNRA